MYCWSAQFWSHKTHHVLENSCKLDRQASDCLKLISCLFLPPLWISVSITGVFYSIENCTIHRYYGLLYLYNTARTIPWGANDYDYPMALHENITLHTILHKSNTRFEQNNKHCIVVCLTSDVSAMIIQEMSRAKLFCLFLDITSGNWCETYVQCEADAFNPWLNVVMPNALKNCQCLCEMYFNCAIPKSFLNKF